MEALASLLSFPYAYNLSKRELYEKVIQDVMEGKAGNIHPEVYQAYSDNLRKAVGGVFRSDDYGDKYFDLQAQLQSNVSRFAAYKTYHLTEQLKKKREEWTNDDDFKKVAKAMMNTFNRYQAAEYNTATARARTAKQWTDFNSDPIANELYPNLKWLPSRSANPREEHIPFYGLVLPKTDPFWQHNQPGNLWNCKCDWEETDDPAAPTRPDTICAKGLEGNPAETGQVFTDECTYVKMANGHSYVHAFYRDRMLGGAKSIEKKVSTNIDGTQREVLINKVGITESVKKSFGSADYWLRNELLEKIEKYLPNANYLMPETVDLTHNSGKTLKLKRKMERAHKLQIDLGNKSFFVTIFEYKETGDLLFYCIEPI